MNDPSRRDRTRPLELIGLAAGIAAFVGLGVFLGTRLWLVSLQFAGGAFIVALVVLAMLLLAASPHDAGSLDDEGESRH